MKVININNTVVDEVSRMSQNATTKMKTNLSICDGDDVGGDVGRHITSLGLDDGQGSEGATTEVVVHLGSSLQQTGVQVEHITRVSLTTRGTTQQQGHLTVGNGLSGRRKQLKLTLLHLGMRLQFHY